MALDERERLELRHALVEALGSEQGNRLMDQVPPFDWSDVAMKSDLVALEERLELRFDRIDHRFEQIDQRFEMIEPMIDGKLAKNQRELYVALIGMMLAMASVTAAVVGIVLAVVL